MSDPTLKLVVAWSDSRNLCSLVRDALLEIVPQEEIRTLGDDASVVHTAEPAAAIRDRLRERLSAGDHVFVAEFEVWSGHGPTLDSHWLLARGH
ncbi:MAG: hypothetical protein J4N77_04275 [Chloroflexi bacterium]|nr:hypothetical protein [Chloroflexota bacterium]